MMQSVKDKGTQKIIAISNLDESNAQVTTWQTNVFEKIYRCLLCLLSWKSYCKLPVQGMYRAQRPTKENIPSSPIETIHSSRTNQTYLLHSTRSNMCSNNQKFLLFCKYRARATHKPTSSANQRNTGLKNMMKSLFEQMGTMLNLLTTALTKL
jgi:hypothetical protein